MKGNGQKITIKILIYECIILTRKSKINLMIAPTSSCDLYLAEFRMRRNLEADLSNCLCDVLTVSWLLIPHAVLGRWQP